MQRDMKKRVVLFDIALILFALLLVSLYYGLGYIHQASTQTSPEVTVGQASTQTPPVGTVGPSNGPSIFATVSFPSESGFVTVVNPTSGTIEFVLLPNSVGQITVSYTSSNNLTMSFFTDPVPALKVNLLNGTLGADSGLRVTISSITLISIHQVDVNYTVTSGADNGLYVLALPSTIFSTIVNVGAQAYTGPLTWLNGKLYS
ncbi:MAG: hypothetical protein ABSF44_14215 [Candidatus Bathyarchaeia archaeon]|jgi:hypothetical protein